MFPNIQYSETQINKIIKTATVIVDKREQNCEDILGYFINKKIPFIRKSLDFGDYSIFIPKNEELGVPFDISFEKQIAIELKHSGTNGLEELAGNFTEGRTAFENEFLRAKAVGARMYLIISEGSWDDIDSHNYRTQFGEKAYYNSLLSFEWKYNIHPHFIKENKLGQHIYRILIVALKKLLEG